MKISTAFRMAFQTYKKSAGATAAFLIIELCMLLAALSPLLFLTDGTLKWLALLAAPLYLLLILWARVNAAGVMQDAFRGGSLLSIRLADPTAYGKKLLCGLKRGLFLTLWAVPLIAEVFIAKHYFVGQDAFTSMRTVKDIGNGDLFTGVVYLALIVLASLLVVAVGCAFHSGARHAFVLEDRGCLKGHRGKLMLCWLCAQCTMLPLLIAAGIVVILLLPALKDVTALISGSGSPIDLKAPLIILGIGAALSFVLLPLRSLITAAFVHGLAGERTEGAEEEKA